MAGDFFLLKGEALVHSICWGKSKPEGLNAPEHHRAKALKRIVDKKGRILGSYLVDPTTSWLPPGSAQQVTNLSDAASYEPFGWAGAGA